MSTTTIPNDRIVICPTKDLVEGDRVRAWGDKQRWGAIVAITDSTARIQWDTGGSDDVSFRDGGRRLDMLRLRRPDESGS